MRVFGSLPPGGGRHSKDRHRTLMPHIRMIAGTLCLSLPLEMSTRFYRIIDLPPPPDRARSAATEITEAGGNADAVAGETAEGDAAAADPEPGPCITCGDPSTYWDGMVSFAC